jgi:hypothetical protein
MEGIGGVDTLIQTLPQGRDYEKFRRFMTLEVNAAIMGAYEAGASEVLVSDSHGDVQNIECRAARQRRPTGSSLAPSANDDAGGCSHLAQLRLLACSLEGDVV